jgi:hypothetical protein
MNQKVFNFVKKCCKDWKVGSNMRLDSLHSLVFGFNRSSNSSKTDIETALESISVDSNGNIDYELVNSFYLCIRFGFQVEHAICCYQWYADIVRIASGGSKVPNRFLTAMRNHGIKVNSSTKLIDLFVSGEKFPITPSSKYFKTMVEMSPEERHRFFAAICSGRKGKTNFAVWNSKDVSNEDVLECSEEDIRIVLSYGKGKHPREVETSMKHLVEVLRDKGFDDRDIGHCFSKILHS